MASPSVCGSRAKDRTHRQSFFLLKQMLRLLVLLHAGCHRADYRRATVAFPQCCKTECQRGRSLRSTSRLRASLVAVQSLLDQQRGRHARGPPLGDSNFYLLSLSPVWVVFFFFPLFCMNSSLACSDILIPPPNLSLSPPQHIYLWELIKSLSSQFPSHCFAAYFPPPPPPTLFNNQGHGNNCRGRWRAKGGDVFADMSSTKSHHIWMFALCYRHLRLTTGVFDSACFPPSPSVLGSARPTDVRGDIVRCSWVAREHVAKSPVSSHIKELFIPGAPELFTNSYCFIRAESWHTWDEQLCGISISNTVFGRPSPGSWYKRLLSSVSRRASPIFFFPSSLFRSPAWILVKTTCVVFLILSV